MPGDNSLGILIFLIGKVYLVKNTSVQGIMYAWITVSKPIKVQKNRLCFRVKRKRSDSLPANPVAAQATAIDCGEIIFPVTPPVVFAATNNSGVTPIWFAVLACSAPKRAFDEVSEPVKNTPNQPKNGEKNGKATPVPASTNAKVEDRPE